MDEAIDSTYGYRFEAVNASARSFNLPLAQPHELDVVVLDPDRSLAQRSPVALVVVPTSSISARPSVEQSVDPLIPIGGELRIRWISDNNCEAAQSLDLVHRLRFMSQRRNREVESPREILRGLHRIRQVHSRPLIAAKPVSRFV